MSKAQKFNQDIDALAEAIAKDAAKDDTSLQDRLDALKVLTPYYALRLKARATEPDDPDEGGNFGDFSDAINGAEEDPHGATRVRTGSRRGRADA